MSFVLYALVLIASVSSVLLGLDWLASPPQAWRPVQVASQQQQQPAKPVKAAETKSAATKKKSEPRVAAAQEAKTVIKSTTNTDAASSSKPDAIATADAQGMDGPTTTGTNSAPSHSLDTTDAPSDSSTSPLTAAATAVPACDVRACEHAYRSFRTSDCTYQPYDGPRRFCDKGTPPAASTAQTTFGAMTSARAQASCNVQVCAAAYQSFSPADCTYQPYDGPRQLCTR